MSRLDRIRERHEYDAAIAFQPHPADWLLRCMEEAHEDRGALLQEVDRLRAALEHAASDPPASMRDASRPHNRELLTRIMADRGALA